MDLFAPLEVLMERVESRRESTDHFFNPKVLEKLFLVKEQLNMPHVKIDCTKPLDEIVTSLVTWCESLSL